MIDVVDPSCFPGLPPVEALQQLYMAARGYVAPESSPDPGDNCTAIMGATSSTYELTEDDVGFQIMCLVTATNSEGEASAWSNAVGPIEEATVDATAPTLSSATINAAGDTLTLVFSEAVVAGGGGFNTGLVIVTDGDAVNPTYASGTGTNTLVYNLDGVVQDADTLTLNYTQPGAGIQDGSGNVLSTFTGASLTNNSTQSGGGGPTLVASDNFDSYADTSDLDAAANWVTEAGTFTVVKPASDGYIISGAVAAGLIRNTATFNADQRCEVTIQATASGGNFDWIGPAVRVQTGAATGYAVIFSSTDLYLISIVAGTQSTIISDSAVTLSAGNKIAIEVTGTGAATRLTVQLDTGSGWVDKWVNQNPSSDIDGGACGIGAWLLTGPNSIDDWKGYSL